MLAHINSMIFLGVGTVVAVWGFYVAVVGPRILRRKILEGKLEAYSGRIGAARIVGWGMVIFGTVVMILNGVTLMSGG